MQTLRRFWEWSATEVTASHRYFLAFTLWALLSPWVMVWICWMRWGAEPISRKDRETFEVHERTVKALWPSGYKPFVPVPAIAFTHPPDGSLGEHVCTTQGCGMWRVDAEWTCRTEEGRWDAENWRCVER